MAVRFLVFGLCSVLAARPTHLSKYTQDGVQELLTKWRLGEAFGKHFERLGFDGSALDVLDEDMAFDSKLFPNTSPIFWKILLRKVNEFKTELANGPKRRSLGEKLDTSKFKGIRVKSDNSLVALGKDQDVQLVRTGASKLTIVADVEIQGKIKYDGGGGEGDVRIGNSKTECTSANAGAIRWEGPKKGLTVCDGKTFQQLLSFEGEWISPAGKLYSELALGKGEGFARDDVRYCIDCPDPSKLHKSTDFRIGGGDAPFNYYGSCNSKCEIAGDEKGSIILDGSNGNDAVRMKVALLKGDFEYGCSVTAGSSTHNRFGMALWGENNVAQFKSGNSAGYCAQANSGNCYFCRFEQSSCSFRGSYNSVIGISGIHDDNAAFKFVRINGEICVYLKGAKKGCYPQKYTGDMYGAVMNDGGSSRHLDNCYYQPIGDSVKKGNFPYATLSARNADKSPITSYTVVKGALPPGMSLQKTSGAIFGKPNQVEKAKDFVFTVKAEGKNDPIERSFSIQVRHRKPVDVVSTDFSQGTGKVFKYHGSCNSKCEIASDSAGNIKLDGSNGNDAIIMQKPLLVGDFEYGCTVTSGSSTHNRFGMGLWDQQSSAQFRSSNSAGYCAQTNAGQCYFCRFEQSSCSYRGSYNKVFGLNNIHDHSARFMFKRVNGEICGYINDKKQGCYSQKTSAPMYGAVQNDGGSSRNLHKCYYKTSSGKVVYE